MYPQKPRTRKNLISWLTLGVILAPFWHHFGAMGPSKGTLGRHLAHLFVVRKNDQKKVMQHAGRWSPGRPLELYNPGGQRVIIGHHSRQGHRRHSTSCRKGTVADIHMLCLISVTILALVIKW